MFLVSAKSRYIIEISSNGSKHFALFVVGLMQKGIFRITGSMSVVNELKAEYNEEFATVDDKEHNDVSILNRKVPPPTVNDVASLLKAYFKEIKGGLIPADTSQALMEVAKKDLSREVCSCFL